MLQWREKNSDVIFGPHQASDGTLRIMALITLLLQPASERPKVIILDEPELGLHPHAMSMLAGILHSASIQTQIIVATQSTTLIDHFLPHQIIVVDRPNRASEFKRLDADRLADWLEGYSYCREMSSFCQMAQEIGEFVY
ncbi:AAA family ATPase [Candidatus Viridilinea mediisalina]|uniref:ATPase AAA-type core domain-containing protein n=1 Tax=Candidatus Viridilinea mediisalina TaxID=2024553 RepID=A0A2A6RJ51_9CHLR|nr:AAA family ATPase [Candidatus Viridilinea mediisalina]PDW02880.1 hypothetical protein CJ255_11785 [Candidatus Viridilinea mediisalina]